MKKVLTGLVAGLLAASMLLMTACDGNKGKDTSSGSVDTTKSYTYKDSVSTMTSNWNPHTYQTEDDNYLTDFIRVGLYGFVFNDEKHPVEGKEAYSGYKIIPEMAASEPVDVTEKVKAEHPEFNIPESATKGYAYTIDLNPKATWEDGTKIDADTYVYSMQKLLDPKLLNYRATDYYAQQLCIAGAEYYANQGQTKTISVNTVIKNDGLADLAAFLEKYKDADMSLNWAYSFGKIYDPETKTWTEEGLTNEVVKTTIKPADLLNIYIEQAGGSEETGTAFFCDEAYVDWTYPSDISYDTVGLYKSGDYQITMVLGKSLTGFNLLYSLTSNWIVYEDLYEANLKQTGDAWTSTYNTSVETTKSYGPYKLTEFQKDKKLHLERNDAWYGYTDGQHDYVDPTDGKTYSMYMTTAIDTQVVDESSTRLLMFLKGQLMTYGLQAEDMATYRSSKYVHATPSETIFFMILNGNKAAIEEREANAGFDTSKYDLQTLTLTSFRKAVAVTYDKELFASTISPSRSGGYGLIGSAYLYDPETGARYRDTDQAKKALCDFYSVDVSKFASLDEAVDSITGYDPEAAKALYKEAFDEALAAGYITDADNDGKCDQTIQIEYCASTVNSFIEKTVDYLTEKMAEVTAGTPFEGKITFKVSAPYGNDWSEKIKQGLSDTVLGGWSGSAFDPFGLTDLYVNPSYQYDAGWFDATKVEMELTLNINGEQKTLKNNIKNWSDALNGAFVKFGDTEYNFGADQVDVQTRLDILAAFETKVLGTYDYLPMLQDGSLALLTQQAYYVVEEYNPVMGRGGIAYLKYNYDDAAWEQFVASQPDGQLSY